MAKIKHVRVSPLKLPLRDAFRTTLGEKSFSKNVLVVVDCGNIKGYGEASSSLAMPEATQEAMEKILFEATDWVLGSSLGEWEGICESLGRRYPGHPAAISALECALLDAYCKLHNISLARFFGGRTDPVETDYTVAAMDPKRAGPLAKSLAIKGFSKFKVKITGKDPEADFERVKAVFAAAGKRPLLIDANQGLTEKSCRAWIERLYSHGIGVEMIEQPLPKAEGAAHKRLKGVSPYPIALDESLRTFSDLKRLVDEEAADVYNIKIARMGLLPAIKAAGYVKGAGGKLMIGCMMESAIGLSTPVLWAIGSGQFSFIDLDSFLLLEDLPFKPGFTSRGPVLSLKPHIRGSGL